MAHRETYILDLDGPLLDGRYRHYACYREILAARGYTPLSLETYWQRKRERADPRQQLAASGAEALYATFLREWLERIEQPAFLALDRVQPGARERLAEWKAQGIRLILATQRHNPDGLRDQLERLELASYFERVLPCAHSEGGAGKARQVQQAFPELLPAQCLWIGDTEADVEAARAFGCAIYAVTRGIRTEAFLASLQPDVLCSDITAIVLNPVGEVA